jgi:8-oxo-dGTP diphosphatase
MKVNHGRGSAGLVHLELAAAVVIFRNRVLIVRRSVEESFKPGVWGVPSGKMEPTERPAVAALRELREETGLVGCAAEYAGNRIFYSQWFGQHAENLQMNFLVSLAAGRLPLIRMRMPRVKTPLRDQDYKWVPLDRIEHEDLDHHNMETIVQGITAFTADQGRPQVTASNRVPQC